MILSFLFFLFLAYVLFRLVVGFIIPLYRTSRRIRKSFREMQQSMQGQRAQSSSYAESRPPTDSKQNPAPQGDYIDFEEVKD